MRNNGKLQFIEGALPLGLAAARSRHGSDCHRQSFTTVSPLRYPTKGTFEKVPLESSKLSKKGIYQCFLKVLGVKPLFQKGLAGGGGSAPTNPNLKHYLYYTTPPSHLQVYFPL